MRAIEPRPLGLAAAPLLLFALGCSSASLPSGRIDGGITGADAGTGPTDAATHQEPSFDDHWTTATAEDQVGQDLWPRALRQGGAARRLSVPQLQASISALFGGITWDNGAATDPRPMFELLGRTLGVPDYLELNQEDRSATPLFAKFMDDMAGQVCRKAVTRDQAEPNPARRVIIPDPLDVDGTLRFIRLKLHAIYVPEGSSESIAELRDLYDQLLLDTHDARQAWVGVCIAALTAPEMLTY